MEKIDYDNLSNVDLDVLTKKILMDNIKQKNVDEIMMKFDRNMKIRICQQQQRLQTDHESPLTYCHRMRKALESKEDIRELIVSLRVTLGGQNFTWIDEFGQEGGFRLLVSILSKLLQKIERLKNEHEHCAQTEDDLVFSLYELLKSTRACLNCEPGVRFLLQSDSKLCSKLIEALYIAIEFKSDRSERPNNYDQLIIIILTLLAAISFLGKDGNGDFDITGNSLLICNLTTVAEKKNMSSRFACILRCLHFKDPEITYKALVFINTLLSCIDGNDWHVRMLWRNELMLAGLKPLLSGIKRIAERNENIQRAYASFESELKADYEEFLNRFESLKGDVTNLTDCMNMLVTSCKDSDCEIYLQEICLHLLMVNDRKYKRETYFKMFVMCMSEIAFANMGSGPDYGKQITFNLQMDEALQKIESQSNHSRMNKLLDSAIEAKQEAVSLQLQYYRKIEEYQKECSILRQHIQDHKQPLPSVTVFNLPKPMEISSSDIKDPHNATATSVSVKNPPPPPPPPPPPSLLGPPRGKPITSSVPAPPPPPPLLLKKSDGSQPPSNLQRNLLNNAVLTPPSLEIPDYLKKKNDKIADIPMKKIPWNAAIIKPNTINPDSLWAKIDETDVASEDVFEYLKTKYSATSKGATIAIDTTKKQTKKKVPLVIQDQKMLQALAILQGSCKLTFNEWRTALIEVNEKMLNAGIVNQLKNALPPIEMINKLRECTEEEIQNIPEGEQFVAALSTINFLPIRLEAIQLSLSWGDLFTELKSGITIIAESCEEVMKSDGLKQFINLVLLAGNFMGRTKNSTDAFAFELGVLNRLIDTKDAENSETLLHGLIFLLHKKFNGKYSNFAVEDFHHVTKACRIDMTELEKTNNQMNNSVKKVANHLNTYVPQCDNDHFKDKISNFIEQAKKDLFIIDGLWENMQLKWKALQRYLCIEPKKYPLEKLFNDLNTFKNNYQNIWSQISKSLNKNETETSKLTKKKSENRRRPLHQIQPMVAKEAAKMANEKSRQQNADSANIGGVLDKIEQMLEEGKYRPDGVPRTGYRIRRKGQPTVYKFIEPREDNRPTNPTQQIPSAVELLQRLRGLEK